MNVGRANEKATILVAVCEVCGVNSFCVLSRALPISWAATSLASVASSNFQGLLRKIKVPTRHWG